MAENNLSGLTCIKPDDILRAILLSPEELVVIVNQNGYVEAISNGYADFLGVKIKNAIGHHVTEVIENTRMDIVAKTGIAETGEIQDINGEKMIATRIPITHNGELVGAFGRVLIRNTKDLEVFSNKLNVIERELKLYKNAFDRINSSKYDINDIVGECYVMSELKKSVSKVAKTNSNVLVLGESGTGKELFAHSIHSASTRKKAPFICVNCGSIPEQLIESELFGYDEGAFTGAKKGGKIGMFHAAHGGTVFLDEIGELPLAMQVKLLRVLQDREIQRVGSNVRESINVRVVAATNRNLSKMVQRGEFRSDLYYRLNVVTLHVPSLRERKEDIPLLSNVLLSKISKKERLGAISISKAAMDMMKKYDWPGNVRELENVLEGAVNFLDDDMKIHTKHLPVRITGINHDESIVSLKSVVESAEKQAISNALLKYNSCKAKVASELGICRTTLYEKMLKYDL